MMASLRRSLRTLLLAGACAWLGACSSVHYPLNAPLSGDPPATSYTLRQQLFPQEGDEELLVVLTFSGGGTRAAALSYGVLEELSRYRLTWRGQDKRLIDEVDVVYGVSGGSVTAAYWSLHGDAIFKEFPRQFLQRNVQQQLIDEVSSLSNLWRLNSPRFGRGDLLAEHLDRTLFHGAQFDDLVHRRQGPMAIISATDLSSGARFDFLQEYFDLLCSDLSDFSVARAVAASSSVPVVFSPISLWNHGARCPRQRPAAAGLDWVHHLHGLSVNRTQRRLADLLDYLDAERRPYVHLVDGGVADNLALRGLMEVEDLSRAAGQGYSLEPWLHKVREVLIIAVDAGTEPSTQVEQKADVPRITEVVEALADIPIQRFSEETRFLFRRAIERWKTAALRTRQGGGELNIHIAEISLQAEPDESLRHRMLRLPTAFHLPEEEVTTLRQAGARLLRESPDFQHLLRRLNGRSTDAKSTDDIKPD